MAGLTQSLAPLPNKKALPTSLGGLRAPDGNRTRTRLSANRILSPARLPVPPPGPPCPFVILPKRVFTIRTSANILLPKTKNSTGQSRETLEWNFFLSGRRGSNPRPQPWQGCALPTELLPHFQPLFSDWGCKNKAMYIP